MDTGLWPPCQESVAQEAGFLSPPLCWKATALAVSVRAASPATPGHWKIFGQGTSQKRSILWAPNSLPGLTELPEREFQF